MKQLTQKEVYIATMKRAIKDGRGIVVSVSIPELAEPEMIINRSPNVEDKLAYYLLNYDDEMRLKANPRIMVIGVRSLDDKAPIYYS